MTGAEGRDVAVAREIEDARVVQMNKRMHSDGGWVRKRESEDVEDGCAGREREKEREEVDEEKEVDDGTMAGDPGTESETTDIEKLLNTKLKKKMKDQYNSDGQWSVECVVGAGSGTGYDPFAFSWKSSAAVNCYHCIPPSPNSTHLLRRKGKGRKELAFRNTWLLVQPAKVAGLQSRGWQDL